jgi:CRISPR-associated endonuclease/helicase Cas3
VSTLTGRIRGYERDCLLEKSGMQPFLGKRTIEKTHYFVATSAAEVGMDLHSDNSICDLSTLDSMIQRLGRVNRFGECNCSIIDIVYEKEILELEDKWKKIEDNAIEGFNESFQKEIGKLKNKKSRSEERIIKEKNKLETARTQKAKDKITEIVKQLKKDSAEISEDLEKMGKTKEDDLMKHLRVKKKEFIKENPIDWSRFKTFEILSRNKDDMSLENVKMILEDGASNEAFSTDVEKMELTDVLLDLWSQTSLHDHPARPLPESWLHGIRDEYPHTFIAWRDEVEKIASLSKKDIENWFKYHPILTKERLQIPTFEIKNTGTDNQSRLLKQFDDQKLELPVIINTAKGGYEKSILKDIVDNPGYYPLEYATIIFPSSLGGLDDSGFFDPKKKKENIDVADEDLARVILNRHNDIWFFSSFDNNISEEGLKWNGLKESLSKIEEINSKRSVFRLQTVRMDELSEDDELIEEWLVLLKPLQKKGGTNTIYPTVIRHNKKVMEIIKQFSNSLNLGPKFEVALSLAAQHHDAGKKNDIWQTAAGYDPSNITEPLAKGIVNWQKLGGYRHEVGSLIDINDISEISDNEERDLILHLIAVHHGWGRPHFEEHAFPPGTNHQIRKDVVYQSMMRYSRLQERFGWWKLAYIESLLRQADAIASSEEANMEEET